MVALTQVRRHSLVVALGCTLLVDTVAALRGQFEIPLGQFLLGANELESTGHIASTFLPIGYPVLIAGAFAAGARHGDAGKHAALISVNIALSLLLMVMLRSLLIRVASPLFASLAAMLITLQPELVHNLTKVSDTNLTTDLLVWVVLALTRLHAERVWLNALGTGAAIGCASLVRPNMALLALLVFWAVWRAPWRTLFQLSAVTTSSAAAVFLLVTTAVHGRPFFPQNGPYNTFAGANRYTAQQLYVHLNGESSVLPALADLGIHTRMDWSVPSDQPGMDDARDLHYIPLYQAESRKFVRQHPFHAVALCFAKLLNFLRPETNRYHFDDPFDVRTVPWLALKVCSALIVPGWLALLLWQRRHRMHLASTLIILTSLIYTTPFVLINSDPRFRVPLAVLLLADTVRMGYGIRKGTRPPDMRNYLTSSPRPAA